jgi:hypothetical protein
MLKNRCVLFICAEGTTRFLPDFACTALEEGFEVFITGEATIDVLSRFVNEGQRCGTGSEVRKAVALTPQDFIAHYELLAKTFATLPNQLMAVIGTPGKDVSEPASKAISALLQQIADEETQTPFFAIPDPDLYVQFMNCVESGDPDELASLKTAAKLATQHHFATFQVSAETSTS